jgi:hypothetical protein
MFSRHSLAWILSLGLSAGSPKKAAWKGMVLPYSVFLVLGAAAPARADAHNSYLRSLEAGYGGRFSFWNLHVWCSNLLALVPCFFPMCLLRYIHCAMSSIITVNTQY